ncbi:MAG TPA: DegT/DnrJ/EryC1/StrS family aminotransferase [Bacteroidota bacterium]|jgi:perosamine synthetase|nr:DegT/DnrJ/EryC1/StrS family aminotransferase [Bacteroidota bacterium]
MDFFHTAISPQAIDFVRQALETTWISEGPRVKEFEAALSEKLGLVNPVALNSGTTALHLALVVAGIGPGDEVIIPAQTFVATGLAVQMQGAKPVFADIDKMTGNISPEDIRKKITPLTKAIMPVHWAGYPCDMDEIGEIARQHNLIVIEDAAHALGATYRGRSVGSISDFTCFSFQAIKHLTTGDGGAVCCKDPKDLHDAFLRRWFGIDRAGSKPSILGEREFDISTVGYKYHMNDLAAAVGLGNLSGFSANLARRRAIGTRYQRELKSIPGLTLLKYEGDRESSYWLFTFLVERRTDFIRKLQSEGIPSSVVHLRIDRYSVFGGQTPDLPGQEYFNEHQIAIPVHNALSDQDVDKIIRCIRSGW